MYRCDPDVAVTAIAGNRRWSGFNEIGPIPRGCELSFAIAEPEKLLEGCQVTWMVRNDGAEAESVNDLGTSQGQVFETQKAAPTKEAISWMWWSN
ncbi:nucleotide-binding domain-containing protein [Thioclava sp.]|uniref:nucleotide-binding domain-containing protein n=1 Tax=Thioclava sp. TaxID=1933450 RepID=UPI003AA7C23A